MEHLMLDALAALVQVVLIDIALAADNAVVIAMAANGLPKREKRTAVLWGILAATVLRIAFATLTVELLEIVGLVLAGGILLLWVCWKMWRELHPDGLRAALKGRGQSPAAGHAVAEDPDAPPSKTLKQAIVQIVVADVSMSLDNVLAVAGAAREHPVMLAIGLILSIGMMGFAAMMIARLLEKHRWIAYLGFFVVLYVALRMIWEGTHEVMVLAGA